jgi:hypothetical protein
MKALVHAANINYDNFLNHYINQNLTILILESIVAKKLIVSCENF